MEFYSDYYLYHVVNRLANTAELTVFRVMMGEHINIEDQGKFYLSLFYYFNLFVIYVWVGFSSGLSSAHLSELQRKGGDQNSRCENCYISYRFLSRNTRGE